MKPLTDIEIFDANVVADTQAWQNYGANRNSADEAF